MSTVKDRYSVDKLTEKVWEDQREACGFEQAQEEPDGADDGDDADDGERSSADSMPILSRNSSTDGNGSDGVSEVEDVEEQVQAPAPTAAPARRPRTGQRET